MKEFTTAIDEAFKSDEESALVEFKVDDRVLRSRAPHDGQLTFMLAAMGRGQTNDQRFASIINLVMSTLPDEDADYLQSRLLETDPRKRIPVKVIEEIFEFLVSEWFARPTPPSSGSAPSQPSDGQK